MSEKRNRDFFRYQLWRVSGNGSRELVRDETIPRQDLEQRGDLKNIYQIVEQDPDFVTWQVGNSFASGYRCQLAEIGESEQDPTQTPWIGFDLNQSGPEWIALKDIGGKIKNCAGCAYYVSPPHNACNALHSPPSNTQEAFKSRDCPDWEERNP